MMVHEKILADPIFKSFWNNIDYNLFVIGVSEGFKVLAVNPQQLKSLHYAVKPVFPVSLNDIVNPLNKNSSEYSSFLLSNYQRCCKNKKTLTYEENYINSSGRYLRYQTTLMPIFNSDNDVVYICGMAKDITEKNNAKKMMARATDKMIKANVTKTAFIANMSHEMRTPLNGITSALSLLESENETNKLTISAIQASVDSLISLTEDILDYGKLISNNCSLCIQKVDVVRLVNDALSLAERQQGVAPDIQMSTEFQENLPVLMGDIEKIKQIFTHLVSNALKFTRAGFIHVKVSCMPLPFNKKLLVIDVIDSGIGIAEDELIELFRPFHQVDNTVKRAYRGAGLGLSICHELAQLMDGYIDVKSSKGQGSCFSLELPLGCSPEYNARAEDVQHSAIAERALKGHVLLVEDNVINARITERILQQLGFTVVIAEHGGVAIKQFIRQSFDIIFMDWHMPIMDGIEATRALRAMTKGEHIPIIGLTAISRDQDKETCLVAGMNDVLIKPINLARLSQMLSFWLKKTG